MTKNGLKRWSSFDFFSPKGSSGRKGCSFLFHFVFFLVCLLFPTSLSENLAENPPKQPPIHQQQQTQHSINTGVKSTAGEPADIVQNQHTYHNQYEEDHLKEEQLPQQIDGQHNQRQRQETQKYVHPSSQTDGGVASPPPPPPPPPPSQKQKSQYVQQGNYGHYDAAAAANQNYYNYDKTAAAAPAPTGRRSSSYVQPQENYNHAGYKSDVYDADVAQKQQEAHGGSYYYGHNTHKSYHHSHSGSVEQEQQHMDNPQFAVPEDHSGMRDDEGQVLDDTSVHHTNNENSLIEEWEKHMQNFVPETLVTLGLNARSDEYFYEEVGPEPVYIRGGYFVSGDEDQTDVDFTVTDPSGEVVYKKTQPEGLFYFHSTMAGTYSFIISNHRWMETKTVTFAIGTGNETTMHPEHLNSVEANIATIEHQLKDVRAESQYLWIRQRSHMQAVKNTETRVFIFSVIELICLVTVSLFQIYYIKGLVSDKRIL